MSATSINFEAGDHPVPSDPREITAALRAGDRTWERFPYYAVRYGDRGRRFTASDSAWLVTLAYGAQPDVDHEVKWLAQILAARGMPRLLMEAHLEELHDALVAAVPEKAECYARLRVTAETLRAEREAAIEPAAAEELAAELDAMAAELPPVGVPNIGRLVVAAVADERAGIARAVESLVQWLADQARFPRRWVEAVERTLARARALARPK